MESTNIKVWKTRDYSVFKTLLGNRLVDESRVNKIMRSIEEVGYVPNPIIVNEKMEIIDGQGRVETLKRKGLPVYYIIAPGTGVNECISMNINQEQWHRIDYIRSYAERGDIHYQVLLQAIEEFAKDVPETSIIATVAGMLSFPRPKIVTEGRFQVGRPDWRNVLNYLRRYGSFREKIAGAWGNLMKVLQWVYDAEEVDAEVMWKQFQKYGLQHMKSVPSTAETINVLETIYNYKRKGHTYFKEHYDKALAARGYQAGVNHRKIKIGGK